MARLQLRNAAVYREEEVGFLSEEQPCPECRGRGEDGCLTCGGEGYV